MIIVNFTIATNPALSKSKAKVEHDFKTAKDGRLIITDEDMGDSDDEAATSGKISLKAGVTSRKRKQKNKDDEEDDLDDLIDALSGQHLKNKRKKTAHSRDDLADDDVTDTRSMSSGYQPGGRGIHRPLNMGKDEKPKKTSVQPAGSEYRAKVCTCTMYM